jgi:hypothetical protein
VAVNCASRQKRKAQKHGGAQMALPELAGANDPAAEAEWREAVAAIELELLRLPDYYRSPMLLCCIEGLSYEDAAAALGWPTGTVGTRVLRGREMLRKRLVRRGLLAGAAFVTAHAFWPQARANVVPQLAERTCAAAQAFLAGNAVSPNVLQFMKTRHFNWRMALPTLAVSVISLMVGILLLNDGKPRGQVLANQTGSVAVVPSASKTADPPIADPIPSLFSPRKPRLGPWILWKKGTEEKWVYADMNAARPTGDWKFAAIVIITDQFRCDPLDPHAGLVYLPFLPHVSVR